MSADDQTPLLDYAFSTDPAPVPVSTVPVTDQARVNISVSSPTPVYCNQIVVAVPVGADAPSLFAKLADGSLSTRKWALTTETRYGKELWDGLDFDQVYATFTYQCINSTDYLIDYNLVFGVFGFVNGVVGDAVVQIQETSGTDPNTFKTRVGSFPVSKQSPEFYLKNLVATTPEAPTAPVTDFADGAPIRLVWESNGTYFQLFANGQSKPIYAGTATTCTLDAGVSRGTTFVLAASMTGSPGDDTPEGGYEPIYLYDSLAVSVSNPVLTPKRVTVTHGLSVSGPSTLGPTNIGMLIADSVSTSGPLDARGGATINRADLGGLTVTGGSTLNGATVEGTLNGTGSASLKNLTVNGLTGSSGRVALLGSGTKLAEGTNIPQQGVQAQTDGFALAQVLTPGDNGVSSFAYGNIYTMGTWFQVQGGTVGSFGADWRSVMNNNPNALTVPIQAGTTWYYSAFNASGTQRDSPIQIWWFPMGSASGQRTFRTLSAKELADAPAAPVTPDHSELNDRHEEAATAFVDRLAEVLGATLADESRADLAGLLRQL